MDSAAKIVAELRLATLAGSEQKADITPTGNFPAQPLGNPGLIFPPSAGSLQIPSHVNVT